MHSLKPTRIATREILGYARESCPFKAFTLIELLVVIAIIAILAGLLLPALSRAKGRAQGIACCSNLKQLQLSFRLYTDDNNGTMPLNNLTWNPPNSLSLPGSWVLGNARNAASTNDLRQGTLFPYVLADKVYLCPADNATVQSTVPPLRRPRLRSYAMEITLNFTLAGARPPPSGVVGWDLAGREAAVHKPSESLGFIDLTSESIEASAFHYNGNHAEPPNPGDPKAAYGLTRWGHSPADRHAGSGTLSYLDGHAVSHRWLYLPKHDRSMDAPYANAKDLTDSRWLVRQLAWYHEFIAPNFPGCP